jgi:hypothetical protein
MIRNVAKLWMWIAALSIGGASRAETDARGVEFFESRIRPLLAEHCYECHRTGQAKGGLALDHRAALLQGGDSGPAIKPGDPQASLLIRSVRHQEKGLKMPRDAAKLPPERVADLERWVAMGAPDPRDLAPTAAESDAEGWQTTLSSRRKWWAFQPLRPASPPAGAAHPIDAFVDARLAATGITPSPQADKITLLRRLSFALAGLPPTPAEVEAFLADPAPDALDKQIDRLLASPSFGERWARHWMDWVRYCESHGSEGDPPIPNAWHYRDYLIRAFNADVPYDQLVRENLAGDLLDSPRLNAALGLNESAIGPAQFRFVEHGYAPVDPLDELQRFTENQIDVLSKAFNGLTLACARCHDHKFDPISARDYYGLAGVLVSARPGQVMIDSPATLGRNVESMRRAKGPIRAAIAEAWMASLSQLPDRLSAWAAGNPKVQKDSLPGVLLEATRSPERLGALGPQASREHGLRLERLRSVATTRWTPQDTPDQFFCASPADPKRDATAGAFALEPTGRRIVEAIYPSGLYSNLLSSKHGAVIQTRRFKVDTDAITLRLTGSNGGQARLVVEHYPVPRAGIYNIRSAPQSQNTGLYTWDTSYWKGFDAHVELATADDVALVVRSKNPPQTSRAEGRSSIGIAEVIFHNDPQSPPPDVAMTGALLLADRPGDATAPIAERCVDLARRLIELWRQDRLDDLQAAALNELLQAGLLPNTLEELPTLAGLLGEYRRLEAEVPVARRAPGVYETVGADHPMLPRGDHKHPTDPVARRYLEVFGSREFKTRQSGRLELAEELLSPRNPLTRRVIVNRLWHHLFGRGLVATVDNFGRMGEPPTHPELLDWLATRFEQENWSIKRMIRLMVTSQTWRRSSEPTEQARAIDPDNRLWSRAAVRRLEAEPIRDSILMIAGRLDGQMFGPPQDPNGPPSKQVRRSVYIAVRRNNLSDFLETFDCPKPFTTIGRRDATNVPAQSLTLLNDPLVIDAARQWALRIMKDHPDEDSARRIGAMFQAALSRPPTELEMRRTMELLDELRRHYALTDATLIGDVRPWQDVAQSIFNLKEFVYLR